MPKPAQAVLAKAGVAKAHDSTGAARTSGAGKNEPSLGQSTQPANDTPPRDVQPNAGFTSPDTAPATPSPGALSQTPGQTELSRLDDASALWLAAKKKLRKEINRQIYNEWLSPLKALGFAGGGTLVLEVPGPLHARLVPKNHRNAVEQAVGSHVQFWCDGAPIPEPNPGDIEHESAAAAASAVENTAVDAAAARREEKCPVLPEVAWHSLANEYREIVGPSTEASHVYHFGCFLTAVGAALGRSVYIEKAGRHYPNLFAVLVGKSGGARKGTALHFGTHLALALYQKMGIVKSLDSREGFLEHLAELEKQQEGRAGVSAIVYLAELRSLIEKTRMEGLGNIVPMLCDAYDCPEDLTVHTRKNPISVSLPTVSLCAATTQRWIEGLQMKDLEGGLGNRIMWVPGEPGRPIANPPARDQRRFTVLVRNLRKRIAHWPQKNGTEFRLSPAAEARWVTIYGELYGHNDEDPLIEVLCQRLQNHCLKVALIWAALDGQAVIEQPHLEAAYTFTQFLYDSQWYLFRGFGASPMAKLDTKIIEAVRAAGVNGIRRPLLKKKFWREDMELFNRRINHLVTTDGPLVCVSDGQKVIIYAAEFRADHIPL
jgi:DnaA N-terminal domain